MPTVGPSRRAVLVGGLAAGGLAVSGALSGCLPWADETEPELTRERADRLGSDKIVDDIAGLAEQYDAVQQRFPDPSGLLVLFATEHRAHLAALGHRPGQDRVVGPGTRSGEKTTGSQQSVPPTRSEALASLASLEQAASGRRVADAVDARPDLARLLGSVAACNAVHAALLGAAGQSTADPVAGQLSPRADSPLEPWQELLAAEHAVVYAYGVAGARLRGDDRRLAVRRWNHHRARRDALIAAVRTLGAEPVQTAAAYALPQPIESGADARALAALVEDRLTAVWAVAVMALRKDDRRTAVIGLRDAAVAAARWRGSSVAFPGLTERLPEPS